MMTSPDSESYHALRYEGCVCLHKTHIDVRALAALLIYNETIYVLLTPSFRLWRQ